MVKHTIGDSGMEPISQVAPQAGSSTDADVLADLQRTSDGFAVAISESGDMHLSQSEVRRSSLLSTLYDVSGIGDVVPLGLSARLLREWHAAVSGSRGGAGCDVSLPSLARILEVCAPVLLCVVHAASMLQVPGTLWHTPGLAHWHSGAALWRLVLLPSSSHGAALILPLQSTAYSERCPCTTLPCSSHGVAARPRTS